MRHIILILSLVIIVGCSSVPAKWETLTGSKSDGVVTLQYEKHLGNHLALEDQGVQEAAERCKAWGYNNAIPFSKTTEVCVHKTLFGQCQLLSPIIITRSYQCTVK